MKKKVCRTGFLMLCGGTLVAMFSAIGWGARDLGQVIFEKNSLYHSISVYKRGSVVTLQFGKMPPVHMQSQVNLDDLREHRLEYTKMSFCGLLYNGEPKRMLVLGLGGGVIPRDMRHYFPDMAIDVVDIDPEIPHVAKEFFGFSEDEKLKVHVDDGRMFIKKQLRGEPAPKYDIIILDAFNGDYIPFHLMTKEFLEEVQGVLDGDGVVVANVFYSNRLFDAEFETFLDVFERCQAFYGLDSGNAMLVSGGPAAPVLSVKQAQERARQLAEKHSFSFDIVAVARRLDPNSIPDPDAKVLTDDRAPVNWLRDQETDR